MAFRPDEAAIAAYLNLDDFEKHKDELHSTYRNMSTEIVREAVARRQGGSLLPPTAARMQLQPRWDQNHKDERRSTYRNMSTQIVRAAVARRQTGAGDLEEEGGAVSSTAPQERREEPVSGTAEVPRLVPPGVPLPSASSSVVVEDPRSNGVDSSGVGSSGLGSSEVDSGRKKNRRRRDKRKILRTTKT